MAKQRKPIKRGKPPNPISKAQLARTAARRALVQYVMQRDRRECQARAKVPHIKCGGPLDPHEIIPRSVWKLGYLDAQNVTIVCRNHHDWICDNPDDAEAVGLHGRSWDRPDIVIKNGCGTVIMEYRDESPRMPLMSPSEES